MPLSSWIGQTIAGRYKIDSQLGQGGMSTVYKAADPNLRRTVAVKLIHPHLAADPEFVRRFEEEAAAVAQLRHPNIIQVYDFDHDGDTYYMVLEHVQGETLQARLKALNASHTRLPLTEAARLMTAVCEAVHYAHERGMIHRDLKPANIMINQDSDPVLMDFGVVKMLSGQQQQTSTGAIVGTPSYISPEQVRGERPDSRADIYSLGVVLFEMVAGRCPFDADSTLRLMLMHVNEPVPDIRELADDVPGALVAVVEKALAKQPEDRFQTAEEMAAALRAVYGPAAMLRPASGSTSAAPPSAPTVTKPVGQTAVGASTTEALSAPPVQPPKAATPKRNWMPFIIGCGALGVIGLIAVIAVAFGSSRLFGGGADALPPPEGMIRINGGVYLVGLDAVDENHAALQQVTLVEFWIDQHEVTNTQYAKFVSETGKPPPVSWAAGAFPPGHDNRPVQGVTWDQAADYCAWTRKRLPTEAEWEVTARGPENDLFPWGNKEDSVKLPGNETYDVGTVSANRSRYGVFDLAGNVWEWVAEPYLAAPEGNQVLRGGASGFLKDMAYRLVGNPNEGTMIAAAGFRCAAPQVSGQSAQSTALPVAPTQLAEGVLYQDEFADPTSGWPVGEEGSYKFGFHPQSFYHLQVAAANDRLVMTRDLGFANYIAETDVLVDHTTTTTGDFRYGLAVRRSGENYYAFLISSRTKTWQAVKNSASGPAVLAQGSDDSIQGGAGVNNLRVEVNGPTFIFTINGNVAAEFTDADYANGETGFILETVDETLAHIHYASIVLHEVEEVVAVPTETPIPVVATDTVVPTETVAPTATVVVPPVPEGMVLIPAGHFLMGSSDGRANEKPEHPVLLSAYYMDQFEVRNAEYRECVAAGDCTAGRGSSFTRAGYSTDPAFDDYPVIGVTWVQADAYCAWAGKRLPSEAEWEYAASGPGNFKWPWGKSFDLNLSAASARDTQPVGSYPNGASPFGVFDMAGNVNEWVADSFAPTFYADSPASNPLNTEGTQNIFRGGSFDNADGSFFTTSRRYPQGRGFTDVDIGFRCAQDAPEVNAAVPQAEHDALVAEFCEVYAAYKPDGVCP
ncbi:MAG: SUMF1/EgtB/PvdO family nonheme iron enzyme [Chloroflexi bacterium]|nr:SUMF1/EgtB/PvdO family nonheme iron enzyme [Chloroflexota bacterium]